MKCIQRGEILNDGIPGTAWSLTVRRRYPKADRQVDWCMQVIRWARMVQNVGFDKTKAADYQVSLIVW